MENQIQYKFFDDSNNTCQCVCVCVWPLAALTSDEAWLRHLESS